MIQPRELVQNTWQSLIPHYLPAPQQFDLWLRRHDYTTVLHAITQTAKKAIKLNGTMTAEHMVRFCSKVMNTTAARQQLSGGGPAIRPEVTI
jgi:hypothetical protein